MKNSKMSILCIALFLTLNGCNRMNTWTLRTDDTKLVIGVDASQKLCIMELTNPETAWNWTKSPSVFQFMDSVWVDGSTFKTDWAYQSGIINESNGTILTLTFKNTNPAMELKSVWQARNGQGPVRHTMFIKNTSGKTVRIYEQESLFLKVSGPEKKTHVRYINDDGSSPDSIGVYNDLLTEDYQKKLRISEADKDWIPFVALDANSANGLYVGWEWSIGRINITTEANGEHTVLKVGNGDEFRTDLFAGETFEVPSGFIGAYKGDLDDCGNSLRKYLFNYSMPDIIKNDTGFPKVEWNAFAPTGKKQGSWDPVESKYYPFIDDIAPLGFEDVVIDVGWWSPTINRYPEENDPFHYIADPVDWPSGMPAASDYAHQKGMRFGLYCWIKPERLLSESGRNRVVSQLTYLIKDLKADFYRSDGTIISSDSSLINHTPGAEQRAHYREDIGYWSTKGYYSVIDSMYKQIPGFLWENCSNGGRLKDYGTLRRAGRIQNQDIYWPINARQSFYDASYALHPMQIAALTGSFSAWQATGSVYEFRCSSMGASYWHPDAPNGGNGGPVWSTKQREDIKNAVSTYKNKIRPLIRNGNLYHIFPRPDDVVWDGIEYFDPSAQKGAVYIFKPKSTVNTQSVRLKGLDPNSEYKLTFEDGTNGNSILKGSELMSSGVAVTLNGEFISEWMFFEKK
jgi:hypothetical protein